MGLETTGAPLYQMNGDKGVNRLDFHGTYQDPHFPRRVQPAVVLCSYSLDGSKEFVLFDISFFTLGDAF